MLRTDRKTETTRQTAKEQKLTPQKQRRNDALSPAAALEAILSGANLDQLPAGSMLSLSHTVGNSALADMIARRETTPELDSRPLPQGECTAAPMEWKGGVPSLTDVPAFGDASLPAGAAPMAI